MRGNHSQIQTCLFAGEESLSCCWRWSRQLLPSPALLHGLAIRECLVRRPPRPHQLRVSRRAAQSPKQGLASTWSSSLFLAPHLRRSWRRLRGSQGKNINFSKYFLDQYGLIVENFHCLDETINKNDICILSSISYNLIGLLKILLNQSLYLLIASKNARRLNKNAISSVWIVSYQSIDSQFQILWHSNALKVNEAGEGSTRR